MKTCLYIIAVLLALPLLAGPLVADEIAGYSSDSFQISVSADSANKLSVSISSPRIEAAEVFDVPSPSRIVIDIRGLKVARNISLPLKDTSVLKSVRVGAHADKLRVVLDFGKSQLPSYSHKSSPGRLEILTGDGAATAAPAVKTTVLQNAPPEIQLTATQAPTVTPPPAPTRTPTFTSQPAATTTPAPALETRASPTATLTPQAPTPVPATSTSSPVPVEEPEKNVSPDTTTPAAQISLSTPVSSPAARQIKGLNFEVQENTAVLMVDLNSPGEFKLVRRDERTFILSIPNCFIATEHLQLPIFPTQEIAGFSYALARSEGHEAHILIGVEQGSRLSSLAKRDKILIKALKQ